MLSDGQAKSPSTNKHQVSTPYQQNNIKQLHIHSLLWEAWQVGFQWTSVLDCTEQSRDIGLEPAVACFVQFTLCSCNDNIETGSDVYICDHMCTLICGFNLFPHQKGLFISSLAVSEFKVVGSAMTVCDVRTCNRTEAT